MASCVRACGQYSDCVVGAGMTWTCGEGAVGVECHDVMDAVANEMTRPVSWVAQPWHIHGAR